MDESALLREEIMRFGSYQFWGTVIIMSLMIMTILVARHPEYEDLIVFVLVLGVVWPFMMGKYDFQTGRNGAFLASMGSPWEISEVRMHLRFMLFFYDFGASLGVLVPFLYALFLVWQTGSSDRGVIVGLAIGLFLMGMALFIYAPMAHRSFHSTAKSAASSVGGIFDS